MKKIISLILVMLLFFNVVMNEIVYADNETDTNIQKLEKENENKENQDEEAQVEKSKIEESDIKQEPENINKTEIIEEEKKVETKQDTTFSEQIDQNVSILGDIENQSIRTIEDGYYQIATALDTNKVLDISGGAKNDCANLQIWRNTKVKQQKFRIKYLSDGYYEIVSCNSFKALDVAEAKQTPKTNVWQYTRNSSDAQKWMIKDAGEGYYYIVSKCNSLYLEVSDDKNENGTNIQVNEKREMQAQKFKFIKTEAVVIGEKTIENGYYQIATSLDESKVLDVSEASKNNQANIKIWSNVKAKQQKFKITYNSDGYYTIENVLSGKALDVANGSGINGGNVWQYDSNHSNAQKWIIEETDDGYYNIISACGDLYLDVQNAKTLNGTNIQIYEGNKSKAQKFKITKTDVVIAKRTIDDGYYFISSALNTNKVLDVSGASINNMANIQIWDNVDEKQQKFKVTYNGDGYYTIQNVLSKKVLDVANGSGTNGTNVWQYDKNGSNAQKWMIKDWGDGYYSIVTACNDLYLEVQNAKTSNGTNIQIYEGNNSKAQKFKFTKTDVVIAERTIGDGIYKIAMLNHRNMVLDIDGASTNNGANVQAWSYENVLQQKFRITYNGDGYYTIRSMKSNKVLDVANGSGSAGANVWQYDYNGSNAQRWIIRDLGYGIYNIVSACNEMFLTVSNENAGCGTNVEINKPNISEGQKFIFEKVSAVEVETGYYGSSGLKIKGDSRGQSLKYYKIGNGPNVFFGTFAVHGWEDLYSYDGQALTQIAEEFKNRLINMQDESLAKNWTIYLFPSVNPDGEYYGYTHNGPGRTSLYSAAPSRKGIDINRCWSTGFTRYTTDRNYNGTAAFQSYEAQALRDFLLSRRATNGQTILVDLHGWLNETIGDNGIGSYYRSQYGISKHISTYGNGYLINWARANLGYNGRAARSCLVELPEYNANANSYINATINMLRGI